MTAPTELVTGVDFVSLPTRNLDAAMDFYGSVLGLARSSVWQRRDRPWVPSSRPAR